MVKEQKMPLKCLFEERIDCLVNFQHGFGLLNKSTLIRVVIGSGRQSPALNTTSYWPFGSMPFALPETFVMRVGLLA